MTTFEREGTQSIYCAHGYLIKLFSHELLLRTCIRTDAEIQSLYRVGGVHDFLDGADMVEELLHMSPISDPYVYSSGILIPRLLEALAFSLSSFEAWRSVDPLELGCVCLVILRGYVLYGIADQVNDAALYDGIFEDGSGAFFQVGYAIHTDEKDIFHAAALDLVKYLHPVVFAL